MVIQPGDLGTSGTLSEPGFPPLENYGMSGDGLSDLLHPTSPGLAPDWQL